LQTRREADFKRLEGPFSYLSSQKFRIVYDYIIKNYKKIDQIDDIEIYSNFD